MVNGVREMKRHMAGRSVRGARVTELSDLDVRAIREAAQISQSQVAKLIRLNLHTLQNWEQRRARDRTRVSTADDRRVGPEVGN